MVGCDQSTAPCLTAKNDEAIGTIRWAVEQDEDERRHSRPGRCVASAVGELIASAPLPAEARAEADGEDHHGRQDDRERRAERPVEGGAELAVDDAAEGEAAIGRRPSAASGSRRSPARRRSSPPMIDARQAERQDDAPEGLRDARRRDRPRRASSFAGCAPATGRSAAPRRGSAAPSASAARH